MTAPGVRAAAQAEADARVVHVTIVRQTADTSEVIGHYCRVEPCLPTREQIAEVIDAHANIHDGIDVYATADAVRAMIAPLDGCCSGIGQAPSRARNSRAK